MSEFIEAGIILEKFWNYKSFRPLQKEIISSVLSCHDTFALLPTGGGKSICYQVPAMCMDGICLVISPLISLMSDQVNDLKNRKIKALIVNSFMDQREIDHTLDNAVYGNYKLLYVSPERLKSELFIERFKKMKISFIAVDEAHCISQWGYDFRPSYLDIHLLREFHKVPVMALTATATEFVVQDIILQLKLDKVNCFKKSFARDNIFFSVEESGNKLKRFIELRKKQEGNGIIYVRNRRKCREISMVLNESGFSCGYYHAGLPHEERERAQNSWMSGNTAIIVATNAFGMGIDKSDVRYVVHWDLPESLEAFYQEAGRAGRDGLDSFSTVLYDQSDIVKLKDNLEKSFPTVEEIKSIYNQLGLFYQLAEGTSFMESKEFHLDEFVQRCRQPKQKVVQSLKQLEKEGLILLSASVYQPSKIWINKGKNELLQFRENNPSYSDLIAFLLRAYSGILEQEVKIDEREIGLKTGKKESEVITQLNYLVKTEFLVYKSKSQNPLLTFLTPRLSEKNVIISVKDYLKRKTAQKERMEAILKYVTSNNECRSSIILKYFNEEVKEDCGHCDICLLKEQSKNSQNTEILKAEILKFIGNKSVSLEQLYEHFPDTSTKIIAEICRKLCEQEVLRLGNHNQFRKV